MSSTENKQQARFELGVAMALREWDVLTTAVVNQWGGSESADKRDWMAGAVVDLFFESSEIDAELVEARLLQVMEDEFDVVVEDESAYEVSKLIMDMYSGVQSSDFSTVDRLYQKFLDREGCELKVDVKVQEDAEIDEELSGSDEEAPALVGSQNEQQQSTGPIVDEDGFTLVQSRK
ncbi:hypothetical protein CANCADRAFT_31570 [Tortispora caseinolytica NRRL Y-17796]|uniref:Pre-rRNA-processing protein TSR2 n=1 Tax=Tortispora caseinolytica NRRL Y-17796 TaxID=767744 RepID=A0A1E4TG02_9ASCO|nr:hypothetical protein CANCADRAFT_31570 [Tortispora caseinolytica NRRL Y-17796]